MKTIFKNTIIDILKNKITLYTVIFCSILLLIGPPIGPTIKFGQQGNYTDLSHYIPLTFYHAIVYIFYLAIVFNLSGLLERQIMGGFHEVSLLYISRTKYFFTIFFTFLIASLVILYLSGFLGLILGRILLDTSTDIRVLFSFSGLVFNILFLISLIFLFSLSSSLKANSFLSFFTFIFFSLLNSEKIVIKLFHSVKLSIVSDIVPSVFKLQNEFLRYGLEVELSDRFWIYLLNITLYLSVLNIILFYKIKRFEYNE